MNLEKIFKNIIIVNLGTFIIAIISVFYESDEIFKISDNLSGGILLSNDGTSTAELIILLTYFIIFFVSLYFIYKFKPFGKKLYTISFIAGNFNDELKPDKEESSYSSRHASTPEIERGAQEIVSKHEREARKASSDLLNDFNKKVKVPGNDDTQSSLYSSRHISTQNEEKGAEAIVTKNEEKIREAMKKEIRKKK